MILHQFSIKKILLFTSVGIIAILSIILIATKSSINSSIRNYVTLGKMDHLAECALRLRKNEQDFLRIDSKNPNFYVAGQSRYVSEYDSILLEVKKSIADLKSENVFESADLKSDLNDIEVGLSGYDKSFKDLVASVKNIGFKDEGIVGSMRKAIHEVEGELKKVSSYELMSDMLMLRRHEKDFMLRNDTSYVGKFNAQAATMSKKVSSATMQALLASYQQYFNSYVAATTKVGLNEKSGILAEMNSQSATFEKGLASAREKIEKKEHSSASNSLFVLFAAIAILSGMVVVILILTSNHIIRSIKKIQSYVLQLGKGELPEPLLVDGSDEIAQMEQSLNDLSIALKNTRDFAIEVGNGNFEAKISVFGNSGEVGESLLEMRKKLSQVARERQQQEEENQVRHWINEGISQVNDIVNKEKESIEELCTSFIVAIVRYTETNQAGILLEQHEDSTTYLEMVSTYAYDKKKYYKKRVEIGEGVAGTCFWEKDKIFITDIPKNYSPIASALGEASPNCILALPLQDDKQTIGVLELASFKVFTEAQVSYFEKATSILAAKLISLKNTVETANLLEKSKQQAEEMAAKEEELKQNLEELHATQESFVQREEELKNSIAEVAQKLALKEQEAEQERRELLKKVEEQHQVMETLNKTVALAELDEEGSIKWNNNQFETYFNITKGEENTFNLRQNSETKDTELEAAKWEQLQKGKQHIGISTYRTKSGTIKVYENIVPIENRNNKNYHLLYAALPADEISAKQRLAKATIES